MAVIILATPRWDCVTASDRQRRSVSWALPTCASCAATVRPRVWPRSHKRAALLASALLSFTAAFSRLSKLSDSDVLVVCLCAQWCGVCREYASVFRQVAERFPHIRFVWVDIEDASEQVDPIEVDNFPTLLVAVGAEPRFFGTLTPQPGMLERIVRECSAQDDQALAQRADIRALVQRLRTGVNRL